MRALSLAWPSFAPHLPLELLRDAPLRQERVQLVQPPLPESRLRVDGLDDYTDGGDDQTEGHTADDLRRDAEEPLTRRARRNVPVPHRHHGRNSPVKRAEVLREKSRMPTHAPLLLEPHEYILPLVIHGPRACPRIRIDEGRLAHSHIVHAGGVEAFEWDALVHAEPHA